MVSPAHGAWQELEQTDVRPSGSDAIKELREAIKGIDPAQHAVEHERQQRCVPRTRLRRSDEVRVLAERRDRSQQSFDMRVRSSRSCAIISLGC